MRKTWLAFFPLIILTLVTVTTNAQDREDKSRELAKIRQLFQRINKDNHYQVVKEENAEEILGHATDGGASLSGYFKGDSLHKIVEWIGLSNRIVQNEYYLENGNLVFVYATEQRYAFNDSLQAFDHTKLVPAFYGRYYFKNNQLFDVVLSNKRKGQSEKEDALQFSKSIKSYILLLKKQKK